VASVWAVGDIHGQSRHLEALLAALPRQPEDTTVFLGDYLDRGPDSARVVARVLAESDVRPDQTILLWGNHEDLAAAHFGLPTPSSFEYDPLDWFNNGGIEAMASYGVPRDEAATAPCPPDLRRLFERLRTFWRPSASQFPDLAHVIFVHAGLLPGQQPEEAHGDVLLWVRDEFLKVTDPSGRLVVHGHTPVKALAPQTDKIGIDTGAVYGGPLTALELPERQVFQADGDGRVRSWMLPFA
jgi:serine/threonine protein phosphatase 1